MSKNGTALRYMQVYLDLKDQIAADFAHDGYALFNHKAKLGKVLAHLVFSRDFADRDGFSRTDHCQRHHCVSFPLLLSVLSWLEQTNLLQQS